MNPDTVRKGSVTYRKTQLNQMTLYGISCKDSNKDNICELIDKHANLLRHPVPQITQISDEAITFGKRNHFEIRNVT